MSDENVALMYRWFDEVWNQGRAEAIEEMLAAGGVVHGLGEAGVDVRGAAGFVPFFEKLSSAFPGLEVTIEDTIAEADKVAARWTARFTHKGDQLGIPATGKQAIISGMSIIRVREGQIIEAWNNWDIFGLMQRLGAIQSAAMLLE